MPDLRAPNIAVIPPTLSGKALRLYYSKVPIKEIFTILWPQDDAPFSFASFSNAMNTLVASTQSAVNKTLADVQGLDHSISDQEHINHYTEQLKQTITLRPPVDECALPPEIELAIADVQMVSKTLRDQIDELANTPDEEPSQSDETPKRNPKTERALAIAALANAHTSNFKSLLEAGNLRLKRTVALHALRLDMDDAAGNVSRHKTSGSKPRVIESPRQAKQLPPPPPLADQEQPVPRRTAPKQAEQPDQFSRVRDKHQHTQATKRFQIQLPGQHTNEDDDE